MDKNMDYNTTYSPYDMNFDPRVNDYFSRDPMFNPMLQYEQGFMYYRYLTSQMEYKIKCKEYEKMCKSENKNERTRVVE